MLEATALAEDEHFWFIGLRRNAKQVLDRALRGRRAGLIVDCGAGTGRNLDWLAAYGSPVGVELTPAGLARGRARERPMVRGTVTALPIADARAGLATSFDVLYCLEDADERRALGEMWRVLEPGGLALFNVAALDVLRGAHSILTREVRRYTPAGLRERLDAAGFVTERMTFTNMATFPPTLAIRVFDRLTGRAAHASEADLRVPHPVVNRVFDLALRAEAAAMRVVDLPVGTSLMCLARKPGARVADSG
jgi:SAM-dependent methyltransferase